MMILQLQALVEALNSQQLHGKHKYRFDILKAIQRNRWNIAVKSRIGFYHPKCKLADDSLA